MHVAADLISQAEHDPMAASVLVTDSEELAAATEAELKTQVAASKHVDDRIVPALVGRQSAIVLVRDLADGLKVVDAYGAEHLEIQTRDAAAVADRVRNAGAIFVGPWAPVSLGDYCATPTTFCPPAAAPATPRASPCSRSCAACTSWTTRATRSPRSPTTW